MTQLFLRSCAAGPVLPSCFDPFLILAACCDDLVEKKRRKKKSECCEERGDGGEV